MRKTNEQLAREWRAAYSRFFGSSPETASTVLFRFFGFMEASFEQGRTAPEDFIEALNIVGHVTLKREVAHEGN